MEETNKKIKEWIDKLKAGNSINEELFPLYQIAMGMKENEEEAVRDLFVRPPYDWKRIELLRCAVKDGMGTEALIEMSTKEPEAMLMQKEDFLRQKFYREKEEAGKDNCNLGEAYFIKTIEIMNDRVKGQIEESRRIISYLMERLRAKEQEVAAKEQEIRLLSERKSIPVPKRDRQAVKKMPKKEERRKEGGRKLKLSVPWVKKTKGDEELFLDLISNSDFNEEQTAVMVDGYEEGLRPDEILKYANKSFSAGKMKQIEEVLLKRNRDRVKEQQEEVTISEEPKDVTAPYHKEEADMELPIEP